MAELVEMMMLVLELVWTLLKIHAENIRSIYRVFVPNDPKDVRGEIVLITGAGHGMGREMAVRFAKMGAIVVCVDINAKDNEQTAKIIQDNAGTAHKYVCDVTDRAGVFTLAEKVKKDIGDVTILVNNAGIMPSQPLLLWTEEKIRKTIDINVTGNLWMIQAFLPAMKERNYGHIVAMSSMAGLGGIKNLVPYCGTKFAVRGIMEALEIELYDETDGKTNIKFTTICPYMVDTGLCKNPRIRFKNSMKLVDPGEAADRIVDAIRRDIGEITIPGHLHYINRFFARMLSLSARKILGRFMDAGVNPHD